MMAVEVHRGVEGRAPDGREHSPFSLAGLTLQAGPVAHRGAVFAGVPRRGRGGGPPARRLGSWPAADRAGDRCRSVDACAVGSPGRAARAPGRDSRPRPGGDGHIPAAGAGGPERLPRRRARCRHAGDDAAGPVRWPAISMSSRIVRAGGPRSSCGTARGCASMPSAWSGAASRVCGVSRRRRRRCGSP